ncbi:WD repeat-containing 82 [Hyphodiscus hymeniophilus]|uniref:WD repeat-containing 82 n=1 Tax=Hyphodiscus hymeniophilus TaxID=353542 RepID=A0A9P6VJ25_9HELO|nr:WD repeat-containing 82 [Hyphodiscus hymeniophilus]
MASTPMEIDSPIHQIGANGLGGKANGIPTSTTAKLSEMMPLYRPTKKLFRREAEATRSSSSILSLDFDNEGGLLLTSESDNSMQIYNIKDGKHHKSLLSQKYGANHAMFAHATGTVIHSSTKINHTIRYLSMHDNSYLRYFEGHEQNVTCLSLHPGQDNFLSCSEDNTVQIWDASTKNAVGKLLLNSAYLAAWDPSGNVFAVASPAAQAILLYDFRNFDKEPFSTFDMLPNSPDTLPNSPSKGWNKLEFSNDGKSILLGSTGRCHYLVDAFDGHLKAFLHRGDKGVVRRLGAGDHNPDYVDSHSSDFLQPSTGDCCFSPDGRYVLSGCRGKDILVWDTLAAAQDKDLKPSHELEYKGDSAVIAFNPRYNFFATGDKEVVFWVPDPHAG